MTYLNINKGSKASNSSDYSELEILTSVNCMSYSHIILILVHWLINLLSFICPCVQLYLSLGDIFLGVSPNPRCSDHIQQTILGYCSHPPVVSTNRWSASCPPLFQNAVSHFCISLHNIPEFLPTLHHRMPWDSEHWFAVLWLVNVLAEGWLPLRSSFHDISFRNQGALQVADSWSAWTCALEPWSYRYLPRWGRNPFGSEIFWFVSFHSVCGG